MKKITVLGAGMVGRVMALDLCRKYAVLAVDRDPERLQALEALGPVRSTAADCSDSKSIRSLVRDADLVIGALPGFMGFEALRAVIGAGKNVVDISFFAEDPFGLDEAAKAAGVTAVVDCGVAPGMSNMILGRYAARMEAVESFECLVGGLPFERTWPFQYKAPFSPADVLEEYTRPARLVENGRVVVRPALSDPEFVDIEGVGTLEAFNTDGLRTLIGTMKIPFMKEKTLRYPGHADAIRILKAGGFLDTEPIDVAGVRVRPIDVASRLLFPRWALRDNEPEFTVMKIKIKGIQDGKRRQVEVRMLDRFDPAAGFSSMARTTGFAATAAARLVLDGRFRQTGLVPPERIGENPECFDRVMRDMKDRGVAYSMEETDAVR
jgi:saccharopine dehydrogenase-like NADP-dependent oxidoreductase